MEEIFLGRYRLAVDVEATRRYYEAHPLPWVSCTCPGCRNFVRAAKLFPADVKDFFAALGLDPEKPAETSWYPGTPATASGDAWYHVCGEILERAEPPEGHRFGEYIPVSEKLEAAFGPECHLLPRDFPEPCFQMDTFFQLPWVLEEPNPEIL